MYWNTKIIPQKFKRNVEQDLRIDKERFFPLEKFNIEFSESNNNVHVVFNEKKTLTVRLLNNILVYKQVFKIEIKKR